MAYMTDRVKWVAVMGLFKTAVGTGVLSMPKALESTGVVLFPLLMLGFCLISQYGCLLVAKTLDMMASIGYTNMDPLKVAEFSVGEKWGKWTTLAIVFLDPWGSTAAFFITTADILLPIFRAFSTTGEDPFSQSTVIWVLAILVFPLMLYKDINEIAWVNLLGIATLVAFAFGVLINLLTHYEGLEGAVLGEAGPSAVVALTVIAFAYDGCQMNIFPYYRDLPPVKPGSGCTKGEAVTRIAGIANFGASLCYMLNAYMAFATYRGQIQNDVMNNFSNSVFFLTLKLVFAFTLLLTIPITLFECGNVLREHVVGDSGLTNIILNVALIGSAAGVGIYIPSMYKAFAYVGATTATLWTMVLPPLWFINTTNKIYPRVSWKQLNTEDCEDQPLNKKAEREKLPPPPSNAELHAAGIFMYAGCFAMPMFVYITSLSQ
eukprot:TRINITY_DN2143_c0_g1_i1.p1 TRINITY_DN2143_c0_g1~~TRINITY_DN2143_c0_g1_i1.p1  ORF type:complete len:455 (+),score=57.33 TRINITY_DN2143_c0_g1_i1:68-1366(+)